MEQMKSESTELSNELKAKAAWVAQLMAADSVTPEMFSALSDEQSSEMCLVYMEAIGRKIKIIQGIYLTRADAKQSLQSSILGLLPD
jgi:hypothetical protein